MVSLFFAKMNGQHSLEIQRMFFVFLEGSAGWVLHSTEVTLEPMVKSVSPKAVCYTNSWGIFLVFIFILSH